MFTEKLAEKRVTPYGRSRDETVLIFRLQRVITVKSFKHLQTFKNMFESFKVFLICQLLEKLLFMLLKWYKSIQKMVMFIFRFQ